MRLSLPFLLLAVLLAVPRPSPAGPLGYYRQPALEGSTIVFVAEGDLWRVGTEGGVATRITSHPGEETRPAFAPGGTRLAFTGNYEGTPDVYVMPLQGGLPERLTWGMSPRVAGWTPEGEVLFATRLRSTLPEWQLAAAGTTAGAGYRMLPLAQAEEGVYDDAGNLYFTRFAPQPSHTKRYRGGTAQGIWRYRPGDAEAVPLTGDYPGTSRHPMWWQGRVYFVSDRDGTLNLWSMDPEGGDLRQLTHHEGWDVEEADLDRGRIVYRVGADLRLYDVSSRSDRAVPVTLATDLDQLREHWIDEPMDYVTAVHLSPDGGRVVLTARGQVFVAPVGQGRLVEAERTPGVRYRQARFLPGGTELVTLSDESGEVELWTLPADGIGSPVQLTRDAAVLRWEVVPSPDGRYLAHADKDQQLSLYDRERKANRIVDRTTVDRFTEMTWAPDGSWLAYVEQGENLFTRIKLLRARDDTKLFATTDRYDSRSPAWSPDGKWLYFLSDRHLESLVTTVWGSYQPEPFLDRRTRIYLLPLRPGLRSPFAPADELHGEPTGGDEKPGDAAKGGEKKGGPTVTLDPEGLTARIQEVPLPAGNYTDLTVTGEALFWLSRPTTEEHPNLVGAKIARKDLEVVTLLENVTGYELSADGKKLLVRKEDSLYVIDAAVKPPADLAKQAVDLGAWKLSVQPAEEWRQMFVEAWRLERDYFYDRNLHGVDWDAMLQKYLPLVDRVTSRAELSDLLGQMVSELSALHMYVYGGEMREGPEDIEVASLGAVLGPAPDGEEGFAVVRIYRSDPDLPEAAGPLRRAGVDVEEGDRILMINGVALDPGVDPGALLRNQAGRQVRLRVERGRGPARDVIVEPLSSSAASDLRYTDWEYSRRLRVDELSGDSVGYVHLRAMSGEDFTSWARDFYPVFTRPGLIVDVRHNRGGNIDSWILSRLLRKAWYFWSQRVGQPEISNMQFAYRGHVVVLCDERTASDGEIFAEGIRRLGIGEVIGTRTWGGEIWLSSSNFLVDGGIATAAEYGVFGPEGEWLIEGHGVEPDVVVDNLPHATFEGEDAQLRTAVERLLERIRTEPVPPVEAPPHPDKSFRN